MWNGQVFPVPQATGGEATEDPQSSSRPLPLVGLSVEVECLRSIHPHADVGLRLSCANSMATGVAPPVVAPA